MSKLVVINLGSGDLDYGFPRVTAQLWTIGYPLRQQFIGSLPPAPNLVELYKNWQLNYRNLYSCFQLRSRFSTELDDELEIEEAGITNVSVIDFNELCQKLQESINAWFKSKGFFNINQQLRSQLSPTEEIRLIIETSDELIQRLPWHHWDFFNDYPSSEMALSRPEYKRQELWQPKVKRNKVRILAILGDSQGIDLEAEAKFLKNLPDGETEFLVNPSRQEFNRQLWDSQGWDILFFAGHSQTEGKSGRIYINENQTNNSLTIEQLEEALKAAINNGLKLAIFNSCDGLGLANGLEKLNIPTVIFMREPVPNRVAQDFFNYFLEGFATERLSLYLAVQKARRKLQGIEDEFPGASWLPVICQNPSVELPSWLQLGGIPPCPYRGLFAFREEDANLFFGREKFTDDLVAAVKRKPLVAVVGASGSGKSSVVFAGLIPQLRQDTMVSWQIISFRPGNNPIKALAAAIAPLWKCDDELELALALFKDNKILYKIIKSFVQKNFGTRVVLIVDQFEELYTLCPEKERLPFLDALLTACSCACAFTLVLTLRADFYGYALSYRLFSDALHSRVLNLGPMNSQELLSVIEKPAAQMQVKLENGLTHKLINETDKQPGNLPLLEFALMTLWSKQIDGCITHEAYLEIGSVEEALANYAETVYAQLSQLDQGRMQRMFMQLLHIGQGTEATRRLATCEDVKQENWDLVTRLASSRLLVTNYNQLTGEKTLEIVHEALIKNWGRLEHWLQIDGEFRQWQEQLRATRYQWESSDKDNGALLRGKPLADAEYWQQQRLDQLSLKDTDYIHQSLAFRQQEIDKQKQIRQLRISGLIGGFVGALILAGLAWWQWHNSAISEVRAIAASSEAHFTSNQGFDALIDAITAEQKLQHLAGVDQDTKNEVLKVLQQAIYRVVEYNRLLPKHEDFLWGVAISADGKMIAAASADKTVHVWSSDGKPLYTLIGHKGSVWGVAISRDNQMIASASEDGTVKLWSRDGKELHTLQGHKDAVWGVAISPDNQLIASASEDRTVKLWSRDGKELHTLQGYSSPVWGVAFSPDGQILASTTQDGMIKLWSRDGKELHTFKAHSSRIAGITFSPDGQILASASDDGTVKLWSRDGKYLTTLKGHDDGVCVWGVAFSPDGQVIATANWDNTIKLWSRDGNLLTTLYGHTARVRGVAFSPDGQTLASVGEDKLVRLWKIDHILLKILNGHKNAVIGVSYSHDGKFLASAADDGTVKLWNSNGVLLRTLQNKVKVIGVDISPDDQTIASAAEDGNIRIWSVGGNLLGTFKAHNNSVWQAKFSPNGQLIASAGGDRTIKLWTLDGKLLHTFKGHTGEVREVAFSPNGQLIASASFDHTVKLWKLDGMVTTFQGHSDAVLGLAFSPDGQLIASGSLDRTVKLWKLDGTLVNTFYGHEDGVRGVAFSPDGQTIASASGDSSIKLWSRDGTLLNTLRGHSGAVWKVVFSPDGEKIASTSEDKTVILWNRKRVQTLDPLAFGRNWVRDYLQGE